ncbi:AI-2E family transporter [Paracoccus sp. M683]|uniref:AI-2E family transporter n=1 Tax=Paracoccus sp. M683 TaxID=2594268 RepID=UPI00163DBE17|nr:AI-2E family transporter [Paracoccus sp. M683]
MTDTPSLPPTDRPQVPLATILTVFALIALVGAIWIWSGLLLMAFAAILIAIALRGGARLLTRLIGTGPRIGILLTALIAALAVMLVAATVGPAISAQFNQLLNGLPGAWQQVTDWLNNSAAGQFIERQIEVRPNGPTAEQASRAAQQLPAIFGVLTGTITSVFGGLANLVLLITMALFLALDASTYSRGTLRLVPIRHRPAAARIMNEMDVALGRWMAGQALDMIAVAIITGLGLWALGMPLAMVLGLIAGVTNIIPYIGPFLSGIPAVMFALTQGFDMAVYVAILFIVIQQVEGNILLPMIQKFATDTPPVLTVLAIIAFGTLFGFAGVVLATPLLMVAMILIRRIYVEGVLGDDLNIPLDQPPETGLQST